MIEKSQRERHLEQSGQEMFRHIELFFRRITDNNLRDENKTRMIQIMQNRIEGWRKYQINQITAEANAKSIAYWKQQTQKLSLAAVELAYEWSLAKEQYNMWYGVEFREPLAAQVRYRAECYREDGNRPIELWTSAENLLWEVCKARVFPQIR